MSGDERGRQKQHLGRSSLRWLCCESVKVPSWHSAEAADASMPWLKAHGFLVWGVPVRQDRQNRCLSCSHSARICPLTRGVKANEEMHRRCTPGVVMSDSADFEAFDVAPSFWQTRCDCGEHRKSNDLARFQRLSPPCPM